jgi:molybdate-binding protein
LSLARAFECSVEELFGEAMLPARPTAQWAWDAHGFPCRYWSVEVNGRMLIVPAEASACGIQGHDGVASSAEAARPDASRARQTLAVACCDPAAGLLAQEYQRQTGYRMMVLTRSSRQAIELVESGLVHVAGIHLAATGEPRGNQEALRQMGLAASMQLLHVADWEEGLAAHPSARVRSSRQALAEKTRWVGRVLGAGARRCQDDLLGSRRAPTRVATDHWGVVEAIRNGWADVGICVRLACVEAGLDFIALGQDVYDLCYRRETDHDPRIVALRQVVRSTSYRALLGELPGYYAIHCGEVQDVVVN